MTETKKPIQPPGKLSKLWGDIVESIRGTEQDFTEGQLGRAILLLAIPMVLEMIMESVFAVVDIFFVSKIGAHAVAAVGITESLMTLVYAVSFGLSTATTAMVSRRIGEKKPEAAGVAAAQGILAGFFASFVIAQAGLFLPSFLLKAMGASPDVVEIGASYTGIMLGGNIVIMLLFIINAIFRSAGDAAISMRVLWLGNMINIILDPCLIFGLGPFPQLGVKGAAIATVIGRGIAVAYQLYVLFSGKSRIKLKFRQIKFNGYIMKRLLLLSTGSMGQSIIATSSWIGLMRIIAVFGSTALAGYTIAIRIVLFVLLPSWGLSNAAATLMGQNLGAKKPDRSEKAVWTTGFTNMILLGLTGVVFIFNTEFFIRIFISEPAVVAQGVTALRMMSFGFVFYAMGMVMMQAFNGAGDTSTPMRINFFCFWLFEIPLAWLLAIPGGLKEKGVYFAIIIAESVMTTAGIVLFRRGKWRERKV